MFRVARKGGTSVLGAPARLFHSGAEGGIACAAEMHNLCGCVTWSQFREVLRAVSFENVANETGGWGSCQCFRIFVITTSQAQGLTAYDVNYLLTHICHLCKLEASSFLGLTTSLKLLTRG